MSRSLVLFISCLALVKSFRQEITHSLESETDSSLVPGVISRAFRLATQKAKARSKEAVTMKEARVKADEAAAGAAERAQSHLDKQRQHEKDASAARRKKLEAHWEQQLAAKESKAKTGEWDAAVGVKSTLEEELSAATEKFVKRKAEVDAEVARLTKEVEELQVAKLTVEVKVKEARATAEGLRLRAVAAGNIHVDKLKVLEQSDKALEDAERDLEEQTQAAQEASAAAESAREAAASAKIQLEKATLVAQRRKATVNKLRELKTAVNAFYGNVDLLTDAMESSEIDSTDEAEKPYDRITKVEELKPVLVSFNAVSLAFTDLQQNEAEVFGIVKASIPEIKNNAKEAIRTSCDPDNELEHKESELNEKCGSGMYKVLELELIPMPA
eukprot:TRINITY_DN5927_c0_g3_i2.p1 TRINITY_DN5927_c0_g3~~TRINITY_DN5927_c0_g3_i2.p1  ORF type:complete len:387 (-),score=121.35 TRINITY_DN5927_c0_g3_i2:96-1256(-)